MAEKAREEEEQCRLRAEAEHVRRNAEERRVEQERREKEEAEVAQQRRLRKESELTPLAAPETELPTSKGKGPELAPEPELEGGQESQRCDSCKKWNVEYIRIKVSGYDLRISK